MNSALLKHTVKKKKKDDWSWRQGDGSVVKALALQTQGPEFKPALGFQVVIKHP